MIEEVVTKAPYKVYIVLYYCEIVLKIRNPY